MLLYLQIQMTIISWRTRPPPSHAVGEENSSPRSPCRLPVILPRISTGNGKDSDPLSCCLWEADLVKAQQFLVFWSCTWWEAGLVCTHPPCAPLRHPCQHSWGMKQGLAANRHWSCTAPERLSQHINFHTLSQDHSMCSVCSSHDSLCWYLWNDSSQYSSTYSQPIENSSTAAQFSGNTWPKAGALSLQCTDSRAWSLWRGHDYSWGLDTAPPNLLCTRGF